MVATWKQQAKMQTGLHVPLHVHQVVEASSQVVVLPNPAAKRYTAYRHQLHRFVS
jgi:hypothetical protein